MCVDHVEGQCVCCTGRCKSWRGAVCLWHRLMCITQKGAVCASGTGQCRSHRWGQYVHVNQVRVAHIDRDSVPVTRVV